MHIARSSYIKILLTSLAILVSSFLLVQHHASANYVQHNLVDDNIFLNAASMNQPQIQSFLEARGSFLATYSSYSGRDGANVLASQIIYEASQDYGINPQVVLATLQKEQSLITATNPSSTQLQKAMGYGCPDSASCDTKYYGLYNQVDNGTWQFRKNFERARGNNTWWSTSPGYACNNSHPAPTRSWPDGKNTDFYSPGLYPGNYVTFYDGYATAIQSFTINNASTASLYCYTPHPYNNPNGLYGNPPYGSTGQYYSGSYNFVLWFERWFGSTQPALQISSSLRISTVPQGVFAGAPTTASFDVTNTTNTTQTISVAATARDGAGKNVDFALKTLTVGPHATTTYSDTQTFTTEGTYVFGTTSLVGDTWNDNYPSSSNIDNPRTKTVAVQTIPTITTSPSLSNSSVHVGQTVTATFKIKNNSQQSLNPGQVALAMRDPTGKNVDLPLVDTGSVAPGSEFVYSKSFTPLASGTYTGTIVATTDWGGSWNSKDYPLLSQGVDRSILITVKPTVTITSGLVSSNMSPRTNESTNLSFTLKNFGTSSVNLGYVGLAGRDPSSHNVDPGVVPVTLAAGETRTLTFPASFTSPGAYNYTIISTNNFSNWGTGPSAEDGNVVKTLQVTSRPPATVTASLISSNSSPRVGQATNLSFTLHNASSSSVNLGYVGLAGRDPSSHNVDPGVVPVTLAAGETRTLTFGTAAFMLQGNYDFNVISTTDFSKWDTGPTADSGIVKSLRLTVTN